MTPCVLTRIDHDGITGYGEASMPPYLGETSESVMRFLSEVDLGQFNDPARLDDILDYVEQIAPGNNAAKASVDIALHDLAGKLMGRSWHSIWGFSAADAPLTSMTIGIDTPEVIRRKVAEAGDFRILKIKIGSPEDRQIVATVRELTDKPLFADVNQGWKDQGYALEMAHWLMEQGVVLLEQPMPAGMVDEIAWLTARSPVPVIADEGIRTIDDLRKHHGIYSGINIKLMKCGGMRNGFRMLEEAGRQGLKVMIGCMTETSCAVTAAAQLSPGADWADLDGNHLISNDCFSGVYIREGRIVLPPHPGIGVSPQDKSL